MAAAIIRTVISLPGMNPQRKFAQSAKVIWQKNQMVNR